MKIVCDNCATKYSIADEKVRGKVFKIRCKKCSHVIVVRGGEGAGVATGGEPSMTAELGVDTDEATSVATPGQVAGVGDSVWHLVIDREQVGPMTPAEVRAKFAAGQVDAETYAWREGFGDWLRLASIEEFRDLGSAKSGGGHANAPEALPSGHGANGATDEGATRRTDAADVFAQHQARAEEDDGGAGDLFGGPSARTEAATVNPFAAAAAPASDDPFSSGGRSHDLGFDGGAARGGESLGESFGDGNGAAASGAKLTGQRNENSVLFSLNNLQALASKPAPSPTPAAVNKADGGAGVAPRPGYASSASEGSGLIDIRAMAQQTISSAPAPSHSESASDVPGLGAAPVFSPVVAAPILMPTSQGGMPKWVWGVIVGGGLAVVAIGVLLVVLLTKKPDPVPQYALNNPPIGAAVTTTGGAAAPLPATPSAATQPAAAATAPTTAAAATEPAKAGDEHKATKAAHIGGGSPKHAGGSPSAAPSHADTAPAAAPAAVAAAPVESRKPKKTSGDDTLDKLLNDAAPDSSPKPRRSAAADPGAGSGGGADDPNLPDQLSRDDIKHGMTSVQPRALGCYQSFHVPGTALVSVIIGKNGRVTAADTKGVLAGTPTGDCVAKAVRSASFPKFKGQPMSVTYPFILR